MSIESRQLVEAQISSEGLGVMNNFIIRLAPRGRSIAEIEELVAQNERRHFSNERVKHAFLGTLDIPYRNFLMGDPDDVESRPPEYDYSDLYLDQTPREFFATVDETLVRLGCDPEVIADLYGVTSEQNSLYEMIMPAFLDLIEQGYTVRDLAQ